MFWNCRPLITRLVDSLNQLKKRLYSTKFLQTSILDFLPHYRIPPKPDLSENLLAIGPTQGSRFETMEMRTIIVSVRKYQ